jgi:hypothetical protein
LPARLLALLFGQPDRRFQSSELVRLAKSGNGATQRVLSRFTAAGLVTVAELGNQRHYQANRDSPIFAELHGLVMKTVGVVEPLRRALEPEAAKIRLAFVYGSIAKGTDTAKSDVDLLLVSDDLTHFDAYELLLRSKRCWAARSAPTSSGATSGAGRRPKRIRSRPVSRASLVCSCSERKGMTTELTR